MCKLLLLISIMLLDSSFSFAQIKRGEFERNRKKKVSSVKSTQSKPEEPKVYDINGKIISVKDAQNSLSNNDYLFEKIFADGKLVGVKLVENKMIGKESPDFSLETIAGKQTSLLQQKGKVTVLNFWFVACDSCIFEMPTLNKIADKYKDSSKIDFIAVNYADGAARVKSFLEKKEFKFQIVTQSQAILEAFKIHYFPQTIIIDKDGKIIFWRSSLGKDAESLNSIIESALNG